MVVGQKPFVVMVRRTVTLVPSQVSMAVTGGGGGTSPTHWKVPPPGKPTSTGGVVSRTVMVCEHVAMLVQESMARQVRVTITVRPHNTFVTVLATVIKT